MGMVCVRSVGLIALLVASTVKAEQCPERCHHSRISCGAAPVAMRRGLGTGLHHLALRGGATLGPFPIGPITINPGPKTFVYLNALAGFLYSLSLIGLDPMLPDPTLKYWQQPETLASKCILQFWALTLMWMNGFMLYAMLYMAAPPTGLLKFQFFGWISILSLMAFQVNAYGFTAQQDTLGAQLTLMMLSAYLGFKA